MSNKKDFKYFSFGMSKETMKDYIANTSSEKHFKGGPYAPYRYSTELTQCIIRAITEGAVEYDAKDEEMFKILVSLIKTCGCDDKGVYSNNAHSALKKICIARGLPENAITLDDKKETGAIKSLGNKIKGFFGFGKKNKNNNEAKDTQPTPEQPKEKVAEQKTPKTKNKGLWRTLAVTGAVVTAGLATMFVAKCASDKQNNQDAKTPVKSEIVKPNAQSKSNTKWTYTWGQTNDKKTAQWPVKPFTTKQATSKTHQQNVTRADSAKIIAINNFCDSSLDILMGKKKRDALYNKIQNQVTRGIFKIPSGMSVQRIAHAMEMSRIYEGKSIILDALNSDKALSQAEQEAFAKHIDGIGERGEKLQKRMMQKHKLSSHSKFNKASHAQQKAHIKNLKQLRQIRGR